MDIHIVYYNEKIHLVKYPMEIRKVIEAAQKSGFNLEFKTKKVFEERGDRCTFNQLINFNDNLIEIDITSQALNDHIIVECKGGDPDSYLILIKDASNQSRRSNIKICDNIYLQQFTYFGDAPVSFTGDFYNSNFNRISKDDSKSNFYKAQEQIANAIPAYSDFITRSISPESSNILPIIVTNTKIFVVDFELNEPTAQNYKWAFHRVKNNNHISSNEDLDYIIPVVNIEYLQTFFSSIGLAQNALTIKRDATALLS